MFEDIWKRESVKGIIKAAREATKFIYNHDAVFPSYENWPQVKLSVSGQQGLQRTISLVEVSGRKELRWGRWEDEKSSPTPASKSITKTILNPRFWQSVDELCVIFLAYVHYSSIDLYRSASEDGISVLRVPWDEEEVVRVQQQKMGSRHLERR